MTNTVMQTFKEFLWYGMANNVLEDEQSAILYDESLLRDVKNGRNATIHLSKKHLPLVVEKTVNNLLDEQKYEVTSIGYRFRGMDVFVSHK